MRKSVAQFEKAFASGQLTELMQINSAEASKLGVLHLSILANALFGEWSKALMHFHWAEQKKTRFPPDQLAAVNFALGVGHTRISEYAQARAYFARNAVYRRGESRARFFFFQGLGFYRYFAGDYAHSAKYARRALEVATQNAFSYGALIAEELLAHGLTESGEVRLGMHHLKRALHRARDLEHKSLRHSFRLLTLLNEARFGLNWNCVPALEKALAKLHPQDTYSRNAVKLELANQWVLRGQAARAATVLDEACDSIYASQNRRQISQLNFRLAFLTWLRGRRDEALHLLKSAELHLHKEVDRALWEKMHGLSSRILSSAEGNLNEPPRGPRWPGEDRVADLYAQISKRDPSSLRTVLDEGLHFFLYAFYGLRFDQQALVFDLLPRGLMVIDHGNITVIDKGFSRTNRRILEALAQSHQSKQELIENVWRYPYESSRHDALVYTSISKIRQGLGPAGAWIEGDEKGYRLRSDVRLSVLNTAPSVSKEAPARALTKPPTNTSLNFRQLRILAGFDNGIKEWLGVEEVMQDFDVSRATATRDLGELTEMGYLRRLGRARATKYTRGET